MGGLGREGRAVQNRQMPPSSISNRGDLPSRGGTAFHQEAHVWTADRLDVRLRQGRIGPPQVRGLAAALGAVHAEPAPTSAENAVDHGTRVREASAALRALVPASAAADELASELLEKLGRCGRTLAARAAPARARRLHGGLRADRIHIDPAARTHIEPAPPTTRSAGDPAEELATLLVLLTADEQSDFARRLLAAYAEASGDFALFAGIDVQIGLAALETARATLEAAADSDHATLRQARAVAGRLLAAPRRLAPARRTTPRAVVFAGMMASGKSTLSERLATRLGVPRISGDAVRDRLAQRAVRAGETPLAGFADEATEDVYAAVLRAAGDVLASGRPVIIDATFPTRALRSQLRALIGSVGAKLRFVECRVDETVVRRRLQARARAQRRDESGWLTLLDRFLEAWEPLEELPRGQHLVVDTTRDPRACLEAVEQRLGLRPRAFHRAQSAPIWARTSA